MNTLPGQALANKIWTEYLSKLRWEHGLLGALVLGVLLRLIHYGLGRMLWVDEAMLTINLMGRSGAELIAPLDFRQVAPTGWVLMQDGFVDLFKSYAYGGRLPSLFAGLLSLWLFYRIACELFSKPAAFVAVFAFAFGYGAVYYSAEIKPYAFDLLLWTIIASVALRIVSTGKATNGDLATLGASFIFGSAFTMAAPAIIGGMGGLVIVYFLMKRDLRAAGILSAAALVAGLIFLILSLSIYKAQVDGAGLNQGGTGNYFNRLFAPFPPLRMKDVAWYPYIVEDTVKVLFGDKSSYALVFLAVCGLLIALKQRLWIAGVLIGPVIVALVLSMLKLYPMMARLMLYMVPIIILLATFAIDALLRQAKAATPGIVAGALIFMNIGTVSYYVQEKTFSPAMSDRDISAELATIGETADSEDVVLITRWSLPNFLLYRHEYGLEEQPWIIVESALCVDEAMLRAAGAERVWLIKPFNAWTALDRSHKTRLKPGNKAISYDVEELVNDLAWLRSRGLEVVPNDPFDCRLQRDVSPYLKDGVAPIY